MKKLVSVQTLMVMLAFAAGDLMAQITTPRTPSPAASMTQTIGISTVTIRYSRPKVAGREIWGKLVPYGWNVQPFGLRNPAPWRSGANENTIIQLSHNARIEGQEVPAGTYGLFFVINPDDTGEVILSKDYRSWGSFFYDPGRDQLRAAIKLRTIPMTELLTFDFMDLTKNGGDLVLNWEKKQFPVRIEFAVDDIVMANAAEELKGPTGFNAQGFISAANYALQNNVGTDQALVWIDRAIGQNRSFQALRIKADLLKRSGKTADADKIMSEGLAIATEPELNQYGYVLLNQGEHEKAVGIFILNTQRFPKSANVWDSLGEAYAVKGDKANAIRNFRKALTLNPPDNVRANSEKFLKELGAL